MAEQQFSARGKLMITGEYLALYGADVLARPSLRKQILEVRPGRHRDALDWTSLDMQGQIWFQYRFEPGAPDFLQKMQNEPVALRLWQILTYNRELNSQSDFTGYEVSTRLEWPREWGLGSSSTLIHLISQWLDTDPYEVQQRIFGGSGYDIACAGSDRPLIYTLHDSRPQVVTVDTNPVFERHAAFAWLGRKADTHAAIRLFRERITETQLDDSLLSVNAVTAALQSESDAQTLRDALAAHEQVISLLLQTEPVGFRYFKDFKGVVKSCGAWGGDFVLFFGNDPAEYFIKKYTDKYGLKLWLPGELLVE